MDYAQFERLAEQYNTLPVTETMLADMLTPVSAYLRLRAGASASFLLESIEGDERIARYSFLGRNPTYSLRTRNLKTEMMTPSGLTTLDGNFFDNLQRLLSPYHPPKVPGRPRFTGGLVGFIGYDLVRHIEKIPTSVVNDCGVEDARLGCFPTVLAFDHLRHQITLIANVVVDKEKSLFAQYQQAVEEIEQLKSRLSQPGVPTEGFRASLSDLTSNETRDHFESDVLRAKEYIAAGDIFQVVLSQRFSLPYAGDVFEVYRALRMINPSPYLYYLDFGDSMVIGSSPEILVRHEGRRAEVYPIAGTRPRGQTEEEDAQLEGELLADEKERAEHVMLVDLGRNDLGRVCQIGSVHVEELMKIVRYSHVMHLASRVSGRVDSAKTSVDVFKATFPAGTVSGAPKVRAMEIIDELESTRRGLYAGGVGYFDFSGNLDTCIAIRTIYGKNGHLYFQTGAGIVADSQPDREYDETVNKAKALIEAIALASRGLR